MELKAPNKSGCATEVEEVHTAETRASLGRESRAGWRTGLTGTVQILAKIGVKLKVFSTSREVMIPPWHTQSTGSPWNYPTLRGTGNLQRAMEGQRCFGN